MSPEPNYKEALDEVDRLLRAGDNDQALAAVDRLLEAHPDDARVRRRQGYARIGRGEVDEGIRILRKVVEDKPEDAVSAFELGQSLVRAGHAGEAEALLANLVGRVKTFTPAWFVLGDALVELGRNDEAVEAYRQGMANDPFRQQLDESKGAMRAHEYQKARRLLTDIVGRDAGHAEALAGLEALAMTDGNWIEAERIILEIRRRTSYWPTMLAGLSQLYLMTSRFVEAAETLATLTTIEPQNVLAWNMRGTANEMLMRTDEATAAFRRSLEIEPRQPRAHVSAGNVLRVAGDRAGSEREYRKALELDPASGEAWWALGNLKNFSFSDDDVVRMEAALHRDGTSMHNAAPLHFALGKAREDRELFDQAFTHFAAGNRIQKQASGFNPAIFEQEIDRLISVFGADLIERSLSKADAEDDSPIFIVGMPRTGSTLVEQILATHSSIDATMELPFIGQYVREIAGREASIGPYPESVGRLAPVDFGVMAQRYLAAAAPYRGAAPYFTDKAPDNFVHIGLIAMLFPDARFVDVQRHPFDTCLSAFRQRFAIGGSYTYDIVDLGRYYRGYRRLMSHWANVLPSRVYTLVYENLVTDPEPEIRRLLAFLGLKFESACLSPELTQRTIRTPSSEQVREPMTAHRIGYWRNYREHLLELPGMLQPELRAFGEALLNDDLRARLT